MLGKAFQAANTTSSEGQATVQPEISSTVNNTSSPVHSSWVQSLLVTALEKEPLSKTVPLCYHILLYLRLLKRKLVAICSAAEQGRLQSALGLQPAIGLCFQLLQCLLHRSVLVQQKEDTCETNEVKETYNEEHGTFSYKSGKQGLDHVKDTCCTILHHPAILNSFLWKPERALSHRISQDAGVKLTYNVANLLLAVLPSLTWQQKKILMGPFVNKLCNDGMMEIESAQHGNGNIKFQKCSLRSVCIWLKIRSSYTSAHNFVAAKRFPGLGSIILREQSLWLIFVECTDSCIPPRPITREKVNPEDRSPSMRMLNQSKYEFLSTQFKTALNPCTCMFL